MKEIYEFIDRYLVDLCAEVENWDNTGILPKDAMLRVLGALVRKSFEGYTDGIFQAKRLVQEEAVSYIAKQQKGSYATTSVS